MCRTRITKKKSLLFHSIAASGLLLGFLGGCSDLVSPTGSSGPISGANQNDSLDNVVLTDTSLIAPEDKSVLGMMQQNQRTSFEPTAYEVLAGSGKVAYTPYHGYDTALFNYGNTVHARYPKPTANIALRRPATASKALSYEPASAAVDGIESGYRSKWCTGYGGGTNQWLEIDLGAYHYFDRFVVKTAHDEDYRMGLRYYKIQIKMSNNTWRDIYYVYNGALTTVNDVTMYNQYAARYVRLYVMSGDFDDVTRVYEFKLFNSRGYVPHPGDILLTTSSTPDHAGFVWTRDSTIEAQGEGVSMRPMTKWYNYDDGFWVKRIKNSKFPSAANVADYARGKLGAPYNANFSDYQNTSKFYCTSLVYRAWRSAAGINLDSDLWLPPLTVSDIDDDSDTYRIYTN